jgi:hypothetical protein
LEAASFVHSHFGGSVVLVFHEITCNQKRNLLPLLLSLLLLWPNLNVMWNWVINLTNDDYYFRISFRKIIK